MRNNSSIYEYTKSTQLNLDKFRDIYCPISSILFSIEIQV